MRTTVTRLPKNSAEVLVELAPHEIQPHLDRAAARLSREKPIPGFRPGKAPYTVMEKTVGADVLYHEAAETIVRDSFLRVLKEQKLVTVGQPALSLQKVAPGNPFVYKATIALLPEVQLGEYRTLKVKKQNVMVTDDEVNSLLEDLRRSRCTEVLVTRPARKDDKVEIDFQGFSDGVPLEGATSKTHPIVIGSQQFVPGFEEHLIGMKPGEKKEFTIRFPKTYHDKRLENRNVLFRVTLHSVFQRNIPVADDAFAKSMGTFKTLVELKERLRKNISDSKTQKERERFEQAMLEKIEEISKIGELPDVLVNGEIDKMLSELRERTSAQGMEYPRYLEALKKSEEDLKKEFLPKAEKRIRLALLSRAIAEKERIEIRDDEIDKEIEEARALYRGNQEVEQNLRSDDYRRYLKNTMTAHRVTEFLDELIGVESAA
jgi:trigger factor